MLARRFLYLFALLIALLLAAGLLWSLAPRTVLKARFVPSAGYRAPPPAGAPDYATPQAWVSRPGAAGDPALWLPPGVARTAPGRAAIFFVPPTTYLERDRWNAAWDDPQAAPRTRLFVSGEASAFTAAGRVWAPFYRQATVGAFLSDRPDAARALDLAYGDVAHAFDAFLAQAPADAPIILAGHSQGSFHLLRLLRDKVAGRPVARRLVAVYVVGWPVSPTGDLPAVRLGPCTAPAQTRCLLSWQSFAEPADPGTLRLRFDFSTGLSGATRRGAGAVCVNPLTGIAATAAPAAANPGSLVPDPAFAGARLMAGLVPARCAPDGLLLIGPPPGLFGVAVLPGNNYHVFDYALFWSAVRADASRRLAAWR